MFLRYIFCVGDKYINGEIIPCKYPTYQPKRSNSKYESRRYERRRDGPPPEKKKPRQEATTTDSASGWGSGTLVSRYLFFWFSFSFFISNFFVGWGFWFYLPMKNYPLCISHSDWMVPVYLPLLNLDLSRL